MTWIQTVSGVAFDLLDPKPESVRITDIAHALARIPRFTGHAPAGKHASVAEHSARVCRLLMKEWRLYPDLAWAGLVHDAHETYVGDISSPLKRAMRSFAKKRNGQHGSDCCDFDTVELSVQGAVLKALLAGCFDPRREQSFETARIGVSTVEGYSRAVEAIVHAADAADLEAERRTWFHESPRPWPTVSTFTSCGPQTFDPYGMPAASAQAEWLSLATELAPTHALRADAAAALVALVCAH